MRRRLPFGREAQRQKVADTQKRENYASKPQERERENGSMRPLQLIFPTASWSSYHPSDMETSHSEASSKSAPCPCYSQSAQSEYEGSFERGRSGDSLRPRASRPVPGSALRGSRWSGGGMSARLKQCCNLWSRSTPWTLVGGRKTRNTARSHALLYLALADPVLSTSALLATEERTQGGFPTACATHGELQ